MADYAFLLRNIMDFLYKDNDVQYPGKGRVFYTRRVEEGFKQQEKDFLENLMVRDIMENEIPFALMNDPEKGKVNYLSLYQEKFLSIFDKKRNIKKAYGRLSITNLIFLGIHLGGWIPASRWFNGRIENHDRAIVSNLMKGDKKNGTEPRRNDFISDLSKWQFNPDNETNPISTLSENDRSSPAGYIPITEYIVTCNHELIKNCCPGSRKEHLKDIINDFVQNFLIAEALFVIKLLNIRSGKLIDYLLSKMSGRPGLLLTTQSLLKSGVLGEEYRVQLISDCEAELNNEMIRRVLVYMKKLSDTIEDGQYYFLKLDDGNIVPVTRDTNLFQYI